MSEEASTPRTRRNLLAGALGGLGALVLGRMAAPDPTAAAAGDPLILGQSNNSGTSQTILNNAGLGAAFTLKTTNTSSNATGIFGWSSSTTANATRGVSGRVDGPNSNAVYGNQTAATGTGAAVYGDGNQNHGVVGTTDTSSARGVLGTSSGSGGVAVFGENTSVASGSNTSVGVRGEAQGDGFFFFILVFPSAAVLGSHTLETGAISAAGVWGEAFDPAADGMRAINWDNASGATGIFSSTLASDGNYAGYFSGNVFVDGTITSSTPLATSMDHPLDPANKVLSQEAVISPDRVTIHSGNAKIGADGTATVKLPAWFDAVNSDVRYQLTVVGKKAQAWVDKGVEKNQFTIAADTPGITVSWQVTGVRSDAWAKANPAKAERAKAGAEKGKYFHPEAHGKKASAGVNYVKSGRAAGDKYSKKEILELRRKGKPN